MCLDFVELRNSKEKKEFVSSGIGWKIFRDGFVPGVLTCAYMVSRNLPIGKWLDEKDYRYICKSDDCLTAYRGGFYDYGWHFYETRKEARRNRNRGYEVIRKVKFRGAHSKGKQCGDRVIVAKEILIIK